MNDNLEDYFCIYIDILGYKDRIEKAENNGQLQRVLDYYLKSVAFENIYLKDICKMSDISFKAFSDNIFIALPYKKENKDNIDIISSDIIRYQRSLIGGNYFIRGGISIDKLFVDDDKNIIWGPGLIDAVETEKKANYPIICLSENTINRLKSNDGIKLFNDVDNIFDNSIIKIQNDKWFLDYLDTIIVRGNEPPAILGFLGDHQRLIKYNIENNTENKIKSKYIMLAKYHNHFCKKYKTEFPFLNDYIIGESLFNADTTF